jgi:hypothetical protein
MIERMHREVGAGTLADSFDKPIDGVRGERSATLGREHESHLTTLTSRARARTTRA